MTNPSSIAVDPSTLGGSWVLDSAKTSVVFHTKAMWVLPVLGKAKATEGRATVDADGSLSGTLIIDAASIDTKMKKRDEHLRTADFFDVAKNPNIVFTATSAKIGSGGKWDISGTLALAGKTKPLTLSADVVTSGSTVTVTTVAEIDRTGWGLNWTKMGAGVKNRVEITAVYTKV